MALKGTEKNVSLSWSRGQHHIHHCGVTDVTAAPLCWYKVLENQPVQQLHKVTNTSAQIQGDI